MIEIVSEELTAAEAYKLLVGIVVPRPIAWVATLNEAGGVNLAPFSCYTFVSSDPPMVAISCGRRSGASDGAFKDTPRNARRTGDFVVNVVTEEHAEIMHRCAAEHPAEQSEAEFLGIALAPSVAVAPPRVAAAPIALECRVHDILEFGNLRTQLLVGEVVRFQIDERLYADGKVDTQRFRPLARLGGPHYARLGDRITMAAAMTEAEYGPTGRHRMRAGSGSRSSSSGGR